MPRLAAEVVAVKACGINGLLPAAFVGGPHPFIPRFALTAPPSAARRPYNSSLENFWGEGLPINMPEAPIFLSCALVVLAHNVFQVWLYMKPCEQCVYGNRGATPFSFMWQQT